MASERGENEPFWRPKWGSNRPEVTALECEGDMFLKNKVILNSYMYKQRAINSLYFLKKKGEGSRLVCTSAKGLFRGFDKPLFEPLMRHSWTMQGETRRTGG